MPHHNTTNVYHLYYIVMEEETDLEDINTDDERATDISNWPDKKHKKL